MGLAKTIKNALLVLLFSVLIIGCSDDNDDPFIKRDTNELRFTYKKTSKQFTVRTNGKWSVQSDDSWIQLSPETGIGDGKTLENVTVTVMHNQGEARKGSIKLCGAGKDIILEIYQEDGIFSWGTPYIEGTLLEGEEIKDGRIILPYNKAAGENMKIGVKLSGEGASGITCQEQESYTLTTGEGELVFALKGTPRSLGEIAVSIEAMKEADKEPAVIATKGFVSSNNIIFEMNFDKMIWGGDYMENKPGISAELGYGVNATDPTTRTCKATDDGTSDLMSSSMNATFRADRGISEWTGSKVYEKPGYVKVGTGSAKGYIISPKLDLEALQCEAPCNIFVQFNWARWDNENDPISVTLIGDGEMEPLVLDAVHPLHEWQLVTFKITGATSNTQVRVGSTVAGNNRFFIDNWRVYVSKAISAPVTSKLAAPTGLKADETGTDYIEVSWDKVSDATSYLVELKDATEKVVASTTVKERTHRFEGLSSNTAYKCQVKALYAPNSNFDSDFCSPISANTLVGNKLPTPTVSLFKATHGMLIFDFGTFTDGDEKGRIYTFELAESEKGAAIRKYTARDLDCGIATTTGDYGTGTRIFFPKNRIVFAALQPNKTYYMRLTHNAKDGTPYTDSDQATCSGKTTAAPVLGSDVLIYKDFEDFWWGGNSINLAWGPLPLVKPDNEQLLEASLSTSKDFYIHYPIRNAGDSFNTLSQDKAPAYFSSRWGNDGWTGSKVYEVTGHLKLGTSTATGYITTPALSKLGSQTANVTLTFNAAPYHEPERSEDITDLIVEVVGNGTITDAGTATIDATGKSANMQNSTNVSGTNLLYDEYHWTAHQVKITGADASTKLKISTAAYDKNNSSRKIRMWVDDIKVVKN